MSELPNWKHLSRSEKMEMVRPLVLSGFSSTKIAAHFSNITRNSIIGLCHRNGWKLTGGPGRSVNQIKNAKARAAKIGPPAPKKPRPPRRKLPTPPSFEPEPFDMEDGEGVDVTSLVGIMDLTAHTCRWPSGDPLRPGFGYCGQHTDKGPYCPAHTRRAYIGGRP